MHCLFELQVATSETDYAHSAIESCFDTLDRMEAALSRFMESSALDLLRHTRAGAILTLHPWARDCLLLAETLNEATGGAFDVFYLTWKDRPDLKAQRPLLFARETNQVQVQIDYPEADLGAIGKGFALDKMAELLESEWNLPDACLTSAGSTHLALNPPPGEVGWKLTLAGDQERRQIHLMQRSLSGSGVYYQGEHIKSPVGHSPRDTSLRRVWSVAPTGALADGLSTAFFLMDRQSIPPVAEQFSAEAYLEGVDGAIIQL